MSNDYPRPGGPSASPALGVQGRVQVLAEPADAAAVVASRRERCVGVGDAVHQPADGLPHAVLGVQGHQPGVLPDRTGRGHESGRVKGVACHPLTGVGPLLRYSNRSADDDTRRPPESDTFCASFPSPRRSARFSERTAASSSVTG